MWGAIFGAVEGAAAPGRQHVGALAMMILARSRRVMSDVAVRSANTEADHSGAEPAAARRAPGARAREIEAYAKQCRMDIRPRAGDRLPHQPAHRAQGQFSNLFQTHPPTDRAHRPPSPPALRPGHNPEAGQPSRGLHAHWRAGGESRMDIVTPRAMIGACATDEPSRSSWAGLERRVRSDPALAVRAEVIRRTSALAGRQRAAAWACHAAFLNGSPRARPCLFRAQRGALRSKRSTRRVKRAVGSV